MQMLCQLHGDRSESRGHTGYKAITRNVMTSSLLEEYIRFVEESDCLPLFGEPECC